MITRTAMITQVTTTLSATGIPPKTGMVNAVLLSSSSANVADKFPVVLPPFLSIGAHIGKTGLPFVNLFCHLDKKKSIFIFTILSNNEKSNYALFTIIFNITSYYIMIEISPYDSIDSVPSISLTFSLPF